MVWKLFLTFCNCVKISSFATLRLFLQKCHASHSSVMCAKVTLTYNNNSNYQITIGNSIDLLREQKPNLVSLVKTVYSRFCCAILRTNIWDAIYWVQQNGRGENGLKFALSNICYSHILVSICLGFSSILRFQSQCSSLMKCFEIVVYYSASNICIFKNLYPWSIFGQMTS